MGDQPVKPPTDCGLFLLKVLAMTATLSYFVGLSFLLIHLAELLLFFKNWPMTLRVTIVLVGCFYIAASTLPLVYILRGPSFTIYIMGCVLSIVFVTTVGGFVAIGVYQDTIRKELQSGFNVTFINAKPESVEVKWVQTKFECCGVNNYTDWVTSSPPRVIPESCCLDMEHCVTANYNDVYQKGCYEAVTEYIDEYMVWIIAGATALVVLPFLGAILLCILGAKVEAARERQRNRFLR